MKIRSELNLKFWCLGLLLSIAACSDDDEVAPETPSRTSLGLFSLSLYADWETTNMGNESFSGLITNGEDSLRWDYGAWVFPSMNNVTQRSGVNIIDSFFYEDGSLGITVAQEGQSELPIAYFEKIVEGNAQRNRIRAVVALSDKEEWTRIIASHRFD